MAIDEPFNPLIHRIKGAVKERAVHPSGPIPSVPPILTKFSGPPEDVVESSQRQIDALIRAAGVKKGTQPYAVGPRTRTNNAPVPPKAKGRRQKEVVKPLSGLDIDALLDSPSDSINPQNAIPEYRRSLATASDLSVVESATRQMGAIIRDIISASFGGNADERALEHMGAMRTELLNFEEPELYNAFARDLKSRLLSGELGGDRREMWWKVKRARLGLLEGKESEVSKVTEAEAKEVCSHAPVPPSLAKGLLTLPGSFTLRSNLSQGP